METSGEKLNIPDYRERIFEILQEFGIKVSDRAIEVTNTLLQRMYVDHSDSNSETYKPYHNDLHALSFIRRGVQLWSLWKEIIPDEMGDEDLELILFIGSGHDLVPNNGEEESGFITAVHMNEAGYDQTQIERVFDAIIATTARKQEDGTIIQTKLRQGTKDPLKLLAATVDINGSAMEGLDTMLSDAFNLYLEDSQQERKSVLFKPQNLLSMLAYQRKFLRDRLKARDGDIDYYFEEPMATRIKELYDEHFSLTAKEVWQAAKILGTTNIAETSIRLTLGSASWLVSQSNENIGRLKAEIKRVLSK